MTLDELKRLSKEAHPAPWWIGHISEQKENAADIDSSDGAICDNVYGDNNRFFIISCRAHIDKLIAIAEAAKELNEYDGHYADIDGKLFNNLSLSLAALEGNDENP